MQPQAPLPMGFNPPGPVPPQQQQQQQQQLLQLLSLTNPALLMQLNAQQNNVLNPLALLQGLQQHAVLNALQQSALTNPARDPRLSSYPNQIPGPGAHPAPEQPYGTARGSYARGRGGYRGGRGGSHAGDRAGHEQGYKRPRDDMYQGPDAKRAKFSHPGGPQPGPNSVNALPGPNSANTPSVANTVNVPPGPRTSQSASGSATQPSFTELSSNTSPQTTTEHVVSAPVGHVPLERPFTEQPELTASNEPDVVALGSDSEEELPVTRVTSSSDSEDSDDEEGEISGDASAPPGSESVTPGPRSGVTERKKRKRKKKKKKQTEREVCKYFLNRSCTKGQECPYLHPADVKLEEVCRFYRSGVCRRGDDCIYSHGECAG